MVEMCNICKVPASSDRLRRSKAKLRCDCSKTDIGRLKQTDLGWSTQDVFCIISTTRAIGNPNRFSLISFGEEKPKESGHGEASWQKNRRVEFKTK